MSLFVAGVDEVGRGPLAGPVVTAAVILKPSFSVPVKDSKLLSPKAREALVKTIQEEALCFSYGRAEVEEINALNIHHATLLAMKRAIEGLTQIPSLVLVDGIFLPALTIPAKAVVKGDSLVAAISAASILAKVKRDQEMVDLDQIYPGYGFANHKGYFTLEHKGALERLGPCPIHRRGYAPVKKMLEAGV